MRARRRGPKAEARRLRARAPPYVLRLRARAPPCVRRLRARAPPSGAHASRRCACPTPGLACPSTVRLFGMAVAYWPTPVAVLHVLRRSPLLSETTPFIVMCLACQWTNAAEDHSNKDTVEPNRRGFADDLVVGNRYSAHARCGVRCGAALCDGCWHRPQPSTHRASYLHAIFEARVFVSRRCSLGATDIRATLVMHAHRCCNVGIGT